MTPTLKVNPPVLTTSAQQEETLSSELAALTVGQSLAASAAALAGLQSAAACSQCETVLETARDLLSTEMSQYATKLSSAATEYEKTDSAAAEALGKFAGPVRYETV